MGWRRKRQRQRLVGRRLKLLAIEPSQLDSLVFFSATALKLTPRERGEWDEEEESIPPGLGEAATTAESTRRAQ